MKGNMYLDLAKSTGESAPTPQELMAMDNMGNNYKKFGKKGN